MPSGMVIFVQGTIVRVIIVHIRNISTVTDPILTKLFGPNYLGAKILFDPNFVGPKDFYTQNLFGPKFFWTEKFAGPQNFLDSKHLCGHKFFRT